MGRIFFLFCLLSWCSSSLCAFDGMVLIRVEEPASESVDQSETPKFQKEVSLQVSAIEQKLSVVIPKLEFDNAPFTEVMDVLSDKLQIPIVVEADSSDPLVFAIGHRSITCQFYNIPAGEALKYLTEGAGYKLSFQPNGFLVFVDSLLICGNHSPKVERTRMQRLIHQLEARMRNEQRVIQDVDIRNATLTEILSSISQDPLFLSAGLTIKGHEVAAKQTRISLTLTNILLKDFLQRIAKEFGLQFYLGERHVIFDALPSEGK